MIKAAISETKSAEVNISNRKEVADEQVGGISNE
jgi:hypothetical protein